MNADTHMMFKAHVGIAIGMCLIGALLIIQVTMSFIGVLMCGDCCSGERAVGLFAYIFTMIGKFLCDIDYVLQNESIIDCNFRIGNCLLYSNWNYGYWLDLRFWRLLWRSLLENSRESIMSLLWKTSMCNY